MIDQTEKDKQVFKDTLTGKTIARDVFGTPMVEGEILIHATGGTSAEMRVLKILLVRNTQKSRGGYGGRPLESFTEVSLKVRRATKVWRSKNDWVLQDRHSFITTLQNCVVITDPTPAILELFKDV